MPVFTVLLRLALALLLVLNGAGAATAATRMQLEHATRVAPMVDAIASVQAAKDLEPPCHHQQHQHPASPSVSMGVASGAVDHSHAPGSDCCKTANCGCDCLYSMAVLIVGPMMHGLLYGGTAMEVTEVSGHRAPSLPHLMRPPIG